MGCFYTVGACGLLTLLAYFLRKFYLCVISTPEVPHVDENCWWGLGKPNSVEDKSIKPFKINVPDKDLEDLNHRIKNCRSLTPPLEGVNHEYGINTNLLKEIKEYWETKYNWREREAFLNKFPQFTTNIQGLDIHFVHVKPTETGNLKVIPLILLHGWPGTVREFYDCIPKLVVPNNNRNFVFEVVVPHIPGYGFSEAAARPGLNTTMVAVIFKKLMERLQFRNWYVQGGDWGSEIGTHMAILYPKQVLGLHLNMAVVMTPKAILKRVLGSLCPSLIVNDKHRSKMYPLKNSLIALVRESGYFHIQATRPDTLGIGLTDSPIGLAAYIIEKFIMWAHDGHKRRFDGGLTIKFNYEKLLDSVMIYWISKCITTSMRFYAESFPYSNTPYRKINRIPVIIPSAYAQFGNDIVYMPKTLVKERFKNLLHYSDLPRGGHFGAFEEPELFSDDVWDSVETFEEFYKKHI